MQTSYTAAMAKGLPGQIADSSRKKDVVSRVSGEASAEIPFGVVVAKVVGADEKCVLPVDANSVMEGVVIRTDVYAPGYDIGTVGIKPKVPVSVMQIGHVYMFPEADVVKDDPVFVRHTASGGNTQKGSVSNAAGTGLVLWRGAKWAETGAAGTPVKMDVDQPIAAMIAGLT